jgi:hypothetical protein
VLPEWVESTVTVEQGALNMSIAEAYAQVMPLLSFLALSLTCD